ncbi:hypothetical protein [Paenibacillus shenyangensis]|uniref:hypothetical protein n=1 Tax=Paenibacillus sp. A9 TaxID=1284352 RepID=UPI00037E36E6|nr:hypothetical protein [Paenibacillus sp. A9]
MYYWQVRKYPPSSNKDKNKPKIPTWSSIIDIGKIYDGKIFTPEDYLLIEDKYIKAAKIYMDYMHIPSVEMCVMHKVREDIFIKQIVEYPDCYPKEIIDLHYRLKENSLISGLEFEYASKLALREDIVCQFRYKDKFFLNHSYDYYMDIGSSAVCEAAINQIRDLGLYIDLWEHPYEGNVWEQISE